ncbi:RNA-dependent RNA polymerase [Erysiphe necator associated narnavirus 45]|nr:RNA-dependent RNA polymerase [Erysiphe necator associated narnavirus 45]
MMKKDLSSLRTMVLEQTPIPNGRLGWWFPANLRKVMSPYVMRRTPVLLQFLKLSRALPRISSEDLRSEAVDSYIETVTKERPPRAVPDCVVATMGKVLKPYSKPPFRWSPPTILGSASCLGSSRREGGRSSLLSDVSRQIPGYKIPREAVDKSVNDYLTAREGLIPMHRMDNILAVQNQAASARFRSIKNEIPPSEVLVVPETGAKLRIVTRSDPDLVAVGHSVRKTYFPVLTDVKNISTSEPLGSDMKRIRFRGASKRSLVFSADFTKATDLISHEALSEACRLLRIDPDIIYRGHSVHGLKTRTGCFMGLPASWTLLSMIHYCVAHTVDPKDNFRIKGDDLIALWPPQKIARYKRLAEEVGLIVNDKSAVSKFIGTFCEKDYFRRGSTLLMFPTHSLRIWANGEVPSLSDLHSLVKRGVPRERLVKLQKLFLRPWKKACKGFKLDLYAPPQLCGGGLLHPKGSSKVVGSTTSRALKLAHDGRLLVDPLTRICEYEQPQKGCLIDSMMNRANHIRWVASKDYSPSDVDLLDKALARTFRIATFCDAVRGTLRTSKTRSFRDRARRLSRQAARIWKLDTGGDPIRVTYDESFSIVSRLTPVPQSLAEVVKFNPEEVNTFS